MYISWKLLISTPEEIRSIDYLILVFVEIETTITDTDLSVPQKGFFPSIPVYALQSISGDDSEEFPIIDFGVDAEHRLQFSGFLRIFASTQMISYSTASTKPPCWRHQLY